MQITPLDRNATPNDRRSDTEDRPSGAGDRDVSHWRRGWALTAALAAVGMAWVAAVVTIARRSGFVTDGAPVATVVAVAAPLLVVVGAYRAFPAVRSWVAGLDPTAVLAVQAWRVIGAAFLFGWAAGELPAGFAVPAGIGDIATGVAAVTVALAAARERLTRRALYSFTALGLGDFLVAIVTGVLLRPAALESLPWVLFPALAVPGFTLGHLVAILAFSAQRADRPLPAPTR